MYHYSISQNDGADDPPNRLLKDSQGKIIIIIIGGLVEMRNNFVNYRDEKELLHTLVSLVNLPTAATISS